MKNLLMALIFGALAILVPYLAWNEYSRVSAIYDGGKEGALLIEKQTGTQKGRRGARTYYYAASLEGKAVSLATDRVLSPGVPYRAIYLPETLQEIGEGKRFYDYILGNKGESKWDLFVRKVGTGLLLIGLGLEALWLVCAVMYIRAFLKKEEV